AAQGAARRGGGLLRGARARRGRGPRGPRPAGRDGHASGPGDDLAVLRRDDRERGRRGAGALGGDRGAGLAPGTGLARRGARGRGRMTPERWRRIGDLFDAAVGVDPASRGTWLDAACGGDEELRDEVGRLLAQDERASRTGFLAPPGPAGPPSPRTED